MFGLPWLSPTLLGAVAIGIGATLFGGWLDHSIMRGDVLAMQNQRDAAIHDRDTYAANAKTYQNGLNACNAGVAEAHAAKLASDAAQAQAQKEAATANAKAAKDAAAILAMKPGADLCKSADSLILGVR